MKRPVACLVIAIYLAGCAVRTPHVDLNGRSQDQYDADLADCREQSESPFSDVGIAMGGGALLGAGFVAGGLNSSKGSSQPSTEIQLLAVAGGAVIGALLGLMAGTVVRPHSSDKLKTCLRNRGYQVSGLPQTAAQESVF